MPSLNRVTLIGHLGADPELRIPQNRETIATIRLATTETSRDKSSGERRESTEWHRVVFFNRLAEVVGEHLRKGAAIYVEGRIKTRKWQDKDGQDRYTTEIEVTEMQMLGNRRSGDSEGAGDDRPAGQQRSGGGGGNGDAQAPQQRRTPAPAYDDLGDDIPFVAMTMAHDPAFIRATGRVRRIA